MIFKHSSQRYARTPEPVTPYQRAAQVWDERIGSSRVQARNWRLMALGSLLLAGSLAGALEWLSLQSRVTPYVVEVDKLGEPRAVEPAEAHFQASDAEIAWQLGHFISNVRSVSLDPVVMRQNWLSDYDFVTDRGSRFLNQYARQAKPFAGIGNRTVSVQVTSVVRASDRSFEVKWVETDYDRGSVVSSAHWTAMVSVLLKPPSSPDQLRRNPLGLYVDAVDWSEELEPALGGSSVPSSRGSAAPAQAGASAFPPETDSPATAASPAERMF